MNKNSLTQRSFLSSLLATAAFCSLASLASGCGQGELDGYDSVLLGLAQGSVGPAGTSGGTQEGSQTHLVIPIKKIIAYANGSYIYGLKLIWGPNDEQMHGHTNNLQADELDFTGDPVKEIKYHVDASGYLRGLRLKTVSGTPYPIGYLNVTQAVAFSHANNVFTDLVTYKGSISGTTTIWGATFKYTAP